MSSSGDDLNTQDLMEQAEGKSLDSLAKTGIGTIIFGLVTLAVGALESIVDFLILPFDLFYTIAQEIASAVFVAPWNIITGGGNVQVGAIEATAQSLANTFGFLTLPVAQAVVLATIGITLLYLGFALTGNFLPGVPVDNPIWEALFGTAEEEEGDED